MIIKSTRSIKILETRYQSVFSIILPNFPPFSPSFRTPLPILTSHHSFFPFSRSTYCNSSIMLITINAPPEPPGISSELPGPKRALRRQERVMHIVERFSLFLHNMLTVNYYYTHDWDSLQRVADSVECYLEDLGWVQFYRGQMDRGIDSMMVSTVQADQEFEAVAFDDFTKKLRADIAAVSTITTSSSSKDTSTNNSRHNSNIDSSNNNDNIRSNELFASLSPEPVYLKWTSLIQDQLNFFCLQQYIMDKFKPPSKWQLAEYLSVVLFENI
ncbi:unnamed protein product [Rhizophagus irregularis]|nr:unnamed protein product [Rhizophagus irregularis]